MIARIGPAARPPRGLHPPRAGGGAGGRSTAPGWLLRALRGSRGVCAVYMCALRPA